MAGEAGDSVPERVRSACAWVADRSRSVRIEKSALEPYAAGLPAAAVSPPPDPATELVEGDAEARAAFGAVIEAADGSAVSLADLLAEWHAFADVSTYEGRDVPFFKRAQIAAADVDRMGIAPRRAGAPTESRGPRDLDRLTAFADNLVPQVLRLDGVLRLDPGLQQRIEAGEMLEHGSPEEVELRACAVHAIELLAAATPLSPAEIDGVLWNRGAAERYKSLPRPRSRNTAY
jgi:hypothetical protein